MTAERTRVFLSKIRVERDKRGFCERGRVNSEKKSNESGVKRGFIFLLFLFFFSFLLRERGKVVGVRESDSGVSGAGTMERDVGRFSFFVFYGLGNPMQYLYL